MNKSKLVIIALSVMLTTASISYIQDAEARRSGGFSSSSRSSFSSRSSSRPSPVRSSTRKSSTRSMFSSSSKSSGSARKQKVAKMNSQTSKAKRTPPKPKYGSKVTGTQKVASSKSAYKSQQSAFKPRSSTSSRSRASGTTKRSGSSYTPRRSTTVVVNNYNLNSYNRSTYYSRRSSYYGGWSTPSYAYHGYSSYGVYDSMALWYMASRMSDIRYQRMYYHHRSDPGMIAWRAEADKQARTNDVLRAQLAGMDTKSQALNEPINASYMPEGVDADIFISAEVMEDAKPVLNVCTGPQALNYYHVMKHLGKNATTVNVNPIATAGTAENLKMLDSGKCDAALVQRDGYQSHVLQNPSSRLDYERIVSPYSEVLQMVCNDDSGVEEISDLSSKHTVLIGNVGSGSNVTWSNMVAQNDDYEDINTLNVGGTQAVTRMANEQADCMLVVSGIGNKLMTHVNNAGQQTKLNLVEWDDTSITESKGPSGKNVYSEFTLPSGTYSNLQSDNYFGAMQVDTESITVPADFIVNNSWANMNKQSYEQFVMEVTSSVPTIRKFVSGR